MKKIYGKLTFIFLLLILLSSCKNTKAENDRFYLYSGWKYSELGEPYDFYELPEQNLSFLSSLLDDKNGYIFLKKTFYLPQNFKYKDTYLFLGRVKIAAKVYINDHFIGQAGFFPPHEFTEGEKSSCFKIPKEYINFSAKNTIMICVWCNEYGTLKDIPFIADADDVIHKTEFDNLINSKIYMIFSVVLLMISFIYILVFFLRKADIENLSFSQMCFTTSCYLVTFYIGEYSIIYTHMYSFLLFEQIFNGLAPLLTCYFVINFTRDFLKYNEKIESRIFRFVLSCIAFILPFFGHDLTSSRNLLRIAFIIMILEFYVPTKIIIKGILKKDKLVIKFIICFLPMYFMLILQLIYRIILKKSPVILFLSIGWLTVIFLFLGLLIYNFVKLAGQFEYMNKNLEHIVEDRTVDLEREKQRAVQEIELASFVQQSFLRLDTTNIKDWNLQYFSKAMAGVSGDLYLAFKRENILEGVGIFDISGHGIASGLVTMLVKNIIEKEFYNGFDKPLEEVLEIINTRIIAEKGSIENYLTGMLIRIKGNKLELVNAGHPKALLYRAENDFIDFIQKDGFNQYGAIGIEGFPVNSQTINFEMDSGDELILYTDGIIEAENISKKTFGTEGIIRVFNENKFKSVERQVEAINDALSAFTETQSFSDDITYVILRRE